MHLTCDWLAIRLRALELKCGLLRLRLRRLRRGLDFGLGSLFAEDLDRAMNDFYLNYVPKHPELMLPVKVEPAKPAAAKRDEPTIDTFIRRFQDFVSPPVKKKRPTLVNSPRG